MIEFFYFLNKMCENCEEKELEIEELNIKYEELKLNFEDFKGIFTSNWLETSEMIESELETQLKTMQNELDEIREKYDSMEVNDHLKPC